MERRERILAVTLLGLGINSLYLAARADASLLYFGNVLLHVALGLASTAVLGRLARRHWGALGAAWRLSAIAFGLGAALGAALLFTGATRPFRPLLYAHVALVALAAQSRSGPGCVAPSPSPRGSRARPRPQPPSSRSPRPERAGRPISSRRATPS